MEITNGERTISLVDGQLRLEESNFDYVQAGGSASQVKPKKVTGVEAEEPKYLKYGFGFIRLTHSDSKPLPTEMSRRYEEGRADPLSISLDKKQWAKSQELLEKIRNSISESGHIELLDLTETSFPAPKVKPTKIDSEWADIKDVVAEAITNTPITGYFMLYVDNTDIYIQGGFNSSSRIYIEASGVDNDKTVAARFKEAGWLPPDENSDFLNYRMEVFWGDKEIDQVSNFIVNTLSWVYGLDALSTELSVSVQDND